MLLSRADGKNRQSIRNDAPGEDEEMDNGEMQIDEIEFDKYACFYLD